MIENESQSTIKVAHTYVQRRWRIVPVPHGSKAPILPCWQRPQVTEANIHHYFDGGLQNIGVLLGEPSGWLVDIDLDHTLAVKLASEYLPSTGAIFGRAGKPRSHWIYTASEPTRTRQWRLPDRTMVVELRSTGSQTVFPGSVHPSGERIEWDVEGEPAIVDPGVLQNALAALFDEVCRRLGIHKAERQTGERTPTAPSSVMHRARCYLAKLPAAVSGQGGHGATFRAACVLVIGFGLDRNQALAILREWNERCQPPWTEKELEHKVDDAMRQPGWRGYLLAHAGEKPRAPASLAIERANRHAIEHRHRTRRRAHA